MKLFQILGGVCHWDATGTYPALAATKGKFAPDIVFAESPDHVFEGWGFDGAQKGDARFIKPVPPEGWLYDDKTGTLYPQDSHRVSSPLHGN